MTALILFHSLTLAREKGTASSESKERVGGMVRLKKFWLERFVASHRSWEMSARGHRLKFPSSDNLESRVVEWWVAKF